MSDVIFIYYFRQEKFKPFPYEIKTLDDSDHGSRTFFPGEYVYIFAWKKYPSDRASAGLSANQHLSLANEWRRHALMCVGTRHLLYSPWLCIVLKFSRIPVLS